MEKLMSLINGKDLGEIPTIIFGYGTTAFKAIIQDYERNLAFAGDVLAELSDAKALQFKLDYPGGYGIRFQNKEEVSYFGKCVNAIIGKEISRIEAPLKGEDALDATDPANDEAIMDIRREVLKLREVKAEIQSLMTEDGNDIRKNYVKGKFCRVFGDENGLVKLWISKMPITEDNGGEYLGEFPNACDAPVDVNGPVRGLQGAVNAIATSHFAFFHVEGDDLYLWESWFAGGKEHFTENEFGRLIG